MELRFPPKKFLGSARLGVKIILKKEGLPENIEGVIEFLAGRHIVKETTFNNFNELIKAIKRFWENETGTLVHKSRFSYWFLDYFNSVPLPKETIAELEKKLDNHFSEKIKTDTVEPSLEVEEVVEPVLEESLEPSLEVEEVVEPVLEESLEPSLEVEEVVEPVVEEPKNLFDVIPVFLQKLGAENIIILDEENLLILSEFFSSEDSFNELKDLLPQLLNEVKDFDTAIKKSAINEVSFLVGKKGKFITVLSSPKVLEVIQRLSDTMDTILTILNKISTGDLKTKEQIQEFFKPAFVEAFHEFTVFKLTSEAESRLKDNKDWQEIVLKYGEKAEKIIKEADGRKTLSEINQKTGEKIDDIRTIMSSLYLKGYATTSILIPIFKEAPPSFQAVKTIDPDLFNLYQKAYPFINGKHTLKEIAFITGESSQKIIQLIKLLDSYIEWEEKSINSSHE